MKQTYLMLTICVLLAACGGGGTIPPVIEEPGPTDDEPMPTDDQPEPTDDEPVPTDDEPEEPTDNEPDVAVLFGGNSAEELRLESILIDSSDLVLALQSGALNQSTGRITLGALSGDISETTFVVQLDDNGGMAELTQTPLDYAGFLQINPTTGNPMTGIVGLPTDESEIPTSGDARYEGIDTARLQYIDAFSSYDLVGDVAMSIRLSDGMVRTRFGNLDGTGIFGGEGQSISDAATVSITGGILSGGTFVGGEADFEAGSIAGALSGNESVRASGRLFGPNAEEVGGAFIVDDRPSTGILMLGHYLAEQTQIIDEMGGNSGL